MKKFYLLLFAIAATFSGLNAQYTLLHEFPADDFVYTFDTKTQTMYYVVAYLEETIYFYNEDFSFYKSAAAPEIPGYELYMNSSFEHVSAATFNNDTLIEFTCKYLKDGSSIPMHVILNEDLLQIAMLDSANIQSIYQTVNGQVRMEVRKYQYPNTVYSTQTYLLQDLVNSSTFGKQEYQKPPFPNPAGTKVRLPYKLESGLTTEMKIYDMNGQLLEKIKIGSHFNEVHLDVSAYKSGMYIYRYGNRSGKFLVH